MSDIKKRTFSQTAAAILVFDSTAAERRRAWNEAETNEDVAAADKADAQALRHVQDAYHRDTSDINSLANCHRIDIDSMRRLSRDSTPAAPDLQPAALADTVDGDDADDQADAPAPR